MRVSVFRAGAVLAALLALWPDRPAAAQSAVSQDTVAAGVRHHVIVLLDRSASMKNGTMRREQVETMVREKLPDALFDPGLVADVGRRLLDPARGDVLSIVSFGLDIDYASDFGEFIQTEDGGRPFGLLRQADATRASFDALWSAIQSRGFDSFFSRRWSGIAVAMPLALEYQGIHGASTASPVHRTFIVLVTDDNYNGGDPSLELDVLKDVPALSDDRGAVQRRLNRVQALYRLDGPRAQKREGDIHLKVFEVVSHTDLFSVGALWTFEQAGFQFQRVRGGFRSDYSLQPVENAVMRPERVEAVLLEGETVLDRQAFPAGSTPPRVRFSVSESAATRSDLQVRLRFWVRQSDSVYGMHLLDPDGADPVLARALVRTVPVRFEPPSEILGIFPVGPRTYGVAAFLGADNQRQAARYWNVMAVLFFAGLAAAAVFAWAGKFGVITDPRAMRDHRM